MATGGLSIPKIGATDFGQRLAAHLGHRIVPLRPALVPLTFAPDTWAPFVALAGVSLEVEVSTPMPEAYAGKRRKAAPASFVEDLLFTHRGLSGPAILQISSFWTPGQALTLNLTPSAIWPLCSRTPRTVHASNWPRPGLKRWVTPYPSASRRRG